MDLVPTGRPPASASPWNETPWLWGEGYGQSDGAKYHVVAIDYGIKLQHFATSSFRPRLQRHRRAGDDLGRRYPGAQARTAIFLSNGPGADLAATGEYAVPAGPRADRAQTYARHLPGHQDARGWLSAPRP